MQGITNEKVISLSSGRAFPSGLMGLLWSTIPQTKGHSFSSDSFHVLHGA